MGNEASLPMEMATNFDAEEIKRLGKRFKKLDLDNSGSLSVDEFMSLPELQQVISSSERHLTRLLESSWFNTKSTTILFVFRILWYKG